MLSRFPKNIITSKVLTLLITIGKKRNNKRPSICIMWLVDSIGTGGFIVTSLFTFLIISIRVNRQKMQPFIPFRFKNLKSWLFYGVCASFSSLQSVIKKKAATKTCQNTGWQNVNDSYILCKSLGFSKRISPKLFGISGSNCQR